MAMASNEIGRVSVRVVPDFTYFRKIMRAVLKEFDNKEITVHVKANAKELKQVVKDAKETAAKAQKAVTDGAKKGIKEANKKATVEVKPTVTNAERYRRRMQSQLNKLMDDLEVRLKFQNTDDAELRKFWDGQAAYFQKQLDKIKPDMGNADFIAQARMLDKLMASLKDRSGNVWDSPTIRKKILESKSDVADYAKKHKEVINQWAEFMKSNDLLKQNRDDLFDSLNPSDKGVQQGLREYIYGFRELNGEVNKSVSGVNRLRMRGGILGSLFGGTMAIKGAKEALGIMKAAGGQVKQVGGILSKLTPSFGTGFNLAGYALIGALITPAIALVSGLITAAPAALAAVAVPIAAIALGLEGIGKAAEVARPAFDQLRADISGVFEQSMIPGFEALRDRIIPGVTESFKGVAQSISTLFNETVANLGSEANMGNLNKIITNIGIAAQGAVPGVKNFTDGILKLVASLSEKFPGISDAFNRVSESFVKWVDKITTPDSNGVTQLDTAMKNLGTTLSQLGGIVSDLFSSGFNNLSNPGFGASMISFVEDIRELVNDVLPGLAKSFEGIATALKPLTATVNALGKIKDAFTNEETDKPFFERNVGAQLLGGLGANFQQQLEDWRSGKAAMVAEIEKYPAEIQQAALRAMVRNPDLGLGDAISGALAGTLPVIKEQGVSAGTEAATAYQNAMSTVLSQNQGMFANQPWALGATGINEQVTNQITTQAQAAIDGARQALVPLQEGLQTDINNALMPLGDIAGKVTAAFGETPTLVRGALSQVPGIVTETLGAVGPAADGAMKLLNDSIVAGSAVALLTAQTQAPLIVQPFKDMAKGMAEVGAAMMQGLGGGIRDNVGIAKEAAAQAAIEVKEAAKAAIRSKSPSKDFMDIGRDTQTGLAIGIDNHAKGPIAAIREVMQAIKDVFGSAEGLNLNFFMNEAASSMSSIATSSKEFRSNMVEAGTSPILSSESGAGKLSMTESELEDLKRQKADNALRIAELQAQKNQTEDKAAKKSLQGEIDALQIQQKRLDLLKQEAPLQEERKTAIQQLSDTIATNIIDTIKMPGDFAKATVNAAAQDLGISGNGALPTIANWALDAGTNFIFNVNNMDDALAGQQAQQRKQQVGITGR